MATPPQTPMMGGAPGQGAPPASSPEGGGRTETLKKLAAITRLAQMISQETAATSPEMEQVLSSVQNAVRKVVTGGQGQPQQAPPF